MSIRVFVRAGLATAATMAATALAHAQMPQMVLPPALSEPAPSGGGVAAAPDAASPAPAKPRPKPVPSVVLTNASTSPATEVVVSAGDMTAKLDRPLPSKAKATLRLPKLKGCVVSVAATFEGEGQVDIGAFDICKDKSIRFTD